MTGFSKLWARNCKLFFKDRGAFFSALITPVILLVLYATFLAKVYRDSFVSAMPQGFNVSDALINGTVGAQLVSSLLAVSCVTVSFCSNLLMIQDKCTGAIRDITVSPVKRSTISLAYFCASAAVTLIVTVSAFAVSLVFLAVKGWYSQLSRRSSAYGRHCTDDAFRSGALLLHKLPSFHKRTGVRGRNNSECGLRLCVRCVYAACKLSRNAAKGADVPARHIRHKPYQMRLYARCVRGNVLLGPPR